MCEGVRVKKEKNFFLFSKFFIAFPSGRRTSFLHSNRLAALRSVSLRLQSLNQKTLTDITDATESLHGFVFLFDLSFDFHLIWIVP